MCKVLRYLPVKGLYKNKRKLLYYWVLQIKPQISKQIRVMNLSAQIVKRFEQQAKICFDYLVQGRISYLENLVFQKVFPPCICLIKINLIIMTKEGSEVAFIPDNISNISSSKQRFNEDTSQKVEQSYISKLTKLHINNIDSQSGLLSADIKIPTDSLTSGKNHFSKSPQSSEVKTKIHLGNANLVYTTQNGQRPTQRKLFIHKLIKEGPDQYYSYGGQRRHQLMDHDNTYLYTKRTQTDVISQKQSFIEQEEDNVINQNYPKRQIKDLIFQKDLYEVIQDKQTKLFKNNFDKYKDEAATFVTEIDRFDQFQTQTGWLQHCVNSNYKFLLIQGNDLFNFNKALIMEIQKVQLRAKIIELQIQTNKLKIALRKKPSSKHINFSLDLKFNRTTFLRIPKKIDTNLRTYCVELQRTVQRLRKQDEQNAKQLSLLQFYNQQFKKKVNFAYIYQKYLIEKGKRQLDKAFMNNLNIRNSKLKNSNSKHQFKRSQKSPNHKTEKVNLDTWKNINGRKNNQKNIFQLNQSATSIAEKLRFQKESQKQLINSQGNDYLDRTFNKNNVESKKKNISFPKKICLTHHKQLNHPSRQKFVSLSPSFPNKQSVDAQSYLPLFNTPNRQKKHFYYECQLYLRQLENDYLFSCEEQKKQHLLRSQKGFRQKQILKMKTLNVKNQILDTQVDIVQRKKQLKKENQILKFELKLLQDQIFSKFGDLNQHPNVKKNKSFKNLNLTKSKSPDYYGILYMEAERRLKSFKSSAILGSISRPNIPKSPKKIDSQRTIQTTNYANQKVIQKNLSSESDVRTLPMNKKQEFEQKISPSERFLKSFSKSSKFLKRFKKSLSEDELNLTVKQKPAKNIRNGANPQKTLVHNQNVNISESRAQVIQSQYYTLSK